MPSKASIRTSLLFLFWSVFFIACSGSKEQTETGEQEKDGSEDEGGQEGIEMQATIEDHSHLDGCRYMLIGPNEDRYNPLNLDTAFFEDGLRVEVRYRKKDAITTCMAGTNVHILDIERLD